MTATAHVWAWGTTTPVSVPVEIEATGSEALLRDWTRYEAEVTRALAVAAGPVCWKPVDMEFEHSLGEHFTGVDLVLTGGHVYIEWAEGSS